MISSSTPTPTQAVSAMRKTVLLLARSAAELEGSDDAGGVLPIALADPDAVGFGELVGERGVG
jgi:hypothetical protein